MKNKRIYYLTLILILLLIITFHKNIYLSLQRINLSIMKYISFSLKKQNISYYLIFTFLYGLVHSFSPGHGKTYIFKLSFKYKISKLIIVSAFIAYIQGIISYFISIFFIKTISQLQILDLVTQNIYGITLILLSLFNLFLEDKVRFIHNSYFIIGVFFPCSGVLSVLLLGYTLNKNIPFFCLMLFMSTGIFIALSIFSIIIKYINISLNLKENYIKVFNLIINILILLLGINIIM